MKVEELVNIWKDLFWIPDWEMVWETFFSSFIDWRKPIFAKGYSATKKKKYTRDFLNL